MLPIIFNNNSICASFPQMYWKLTELLPHFLKSTTSLLSVYVPSCLTQHLMDTACLMFCMIAINTSIVICKSEF